MLFPKRKNTLSRRSWEASSFRFLFSVCSFGAFIRCLICSSSFQGRFLAYLVAVAVALLVAVLVPLPEGDPTHQEVLTRQAARMAPVAEEVLGAEALADGSKKRRVVKRCCEQIRFGTYNEKMVCPNCGFIGLSLAFGGDL